MESKPQTKPVTVPQDVTLPLLEGAGGAGIPAARHEESASTLGERQEFFLPVSGFVWYYPEEVAVIDHPAFQRLSRINQLGQAYYVFRGGTHKRMEHVLGAVSVVHRMISAVSRNAEKAQTRGERDRCAELSEPEIRFIRLGALLHDIGHIACGHTLEDELCLFDQHDMDLRLDLVFKKTDWWPNKQIESLESLLNRIYSKYVPSDLKRDELSPSDIVRLIIRKRPKSADGKYSPEKDEYKDKQNIFSKSSEIRANVCENMVGNTICADLLDYIYRDWYHVGKVLPPEDRIFQYMEIRNPDPDKYVGCVAEEERRSATDVFVINLGSKNGNTPKIRSDGVSAILNLLESRYQLAETVLYHRTKLAASSMLDRALYEVWGTKARKGPGGEVTPTDLLTLSDEQLIDFAAKRAEQAKIPAAMRLLEGLAHRKLHRVLYSVQQSSHGPKLGQDLINLFESQREDGADIRGAFARNLESDLGLEPGSIVIGYSSVKPKIAEVQVRVDTTIATFSAYEQKMDADSEQSLSRGHLDAQILRFRDLRRVDFFLAKDVWAKLEETDHARLGDLIDLIKVFLQPLDQAAAQRQIKRIAQGYVAREIENGRNDISFDARDDAELLAAFGDEGTALPMYPMGIVAMRAYVKAGVLDNSR